MSDDQQPSPADPADGDSVEPTAPASPVRRRDPDASDAAPSAEPASAHEGAAAPEQAPFNDDLLAESLRGLPVKLEAELGRAEMPSGRLVGLSPGAVVELDRRAEEPLQIFVNGLPFATGRLIVVDGSEWAVQLEVVAGVQAGSVTSGP